jgi:hypothetical protein
MPFDDCHCLSFVEEIFMQDMWSPCYEKQVCVYQTLSSMTGIYIRKGASILPSSIDECAHSVRLWITPKTKFRLVIESEALAQDTIRRMAAVLDILTEGTHPEEGESLFGQSARKRALLWRVIRRSLRPLSMS